LITGEKIIVRETTDEVLDRVIAFRRAILAGLVAAFRDPVPLSAIVPSAPVEDSGTT